MFLRIVHAKVICPTCLLRIKHAEQHQSQLYCTEMVRDFCLVEDLVVWIS